MAGSFHQRHSTDQRIALAVAGESGSVLAFVFNSQSCLFAPLSNDKSDNLHCGRTYTY